MPKFSVCIEMIFRELPFLERIAAVKAAGLDAVELWGWRDKDLEAIRAACEEHGVRVAAMVADVGGPLTVGGDIDALMGGVAESIEAAEALGCRMLICTTGDEQPDKSRRDQHDMIVAKLQAAAPLLEDGGVTAVLEPLNVTDHPGYYLSSTAEAVEIVTEVGSPNVKLLFDMYHQQVTEGSAADSLLTHLDRVAHVHAADVPGRHEPGAGELDYAAIFRTLDAAGYQGYVGLEYCPSKDSAATLRGVVALTG